MRALFLILVLTATAVPIVAQQPGPRPGMNLPDRWLPFDSLVAALRLTDDQRGAAEALHRQIDSVVRAGAVVRTEMREELERTRDRSRAQVYGERFRRMQQRVDTWVRDLRDGLTDEQRGALDGVRPPRVMPRQQRRGG